MKLAANSLTLSFALSTTMLGAPASAAGVPAILSPVSDWQLHASSENCWISRDFGTESERTQLLIFAYGPNGEYEIMATGKTVPVGKNLGINVTLRWNPDTESRNDSAILGTVNKAPALMADTNLETTAQYKARLAAIAQTHVPSEGRPKPDLEREAAVNQLVIEVPEVRQITFQLGSMGEPLGQLRTCAWQLAEKWGFNVAEQQALSRSPILRNTQQLAETILANFPEGMQSANASVFIKLRLNVDASGSATGCVIQAPKWGADFERDTCRALQRQAKFDPAKSAGGTPAASFVTTTVEMMTMDKPSRR